MTATSELPVGADARERILSSAYDLFARHGIGATGIDAIVKRSGVSRMTLYRHFPSKTDLVLAFLDRRRALWTEGWLVEEVRARAEDPRERLLAIFDVFGDWFAREDFEGCSFINVLLETAASDDGLSQASAHQLELIREFIAGLAAEAGIRGTESFARQWHLLMKGSIVAAAEGDRDAASRAQELGRLLLESC